MSKIKEQYKTIKLLNNEAKMLQQNNLNLDNDLDRPVHEKPLISDKSCLFYRVLTLTKLKYFVCYMISFHCQQGDVLIVKQDIISQEFLKPDV